LLLISVGTPMRMMSSNFRTASLEEETARNREKIVGVLGGRWDKMYRISAPINRIAPENEGS
jgi:hypothetical protein